MLRLLRSSPELGTQTLTRFSRFALGSMLAIVASGVWIALVHVERWPALLGSAYGALLLGKVALLAGVLALAASLRRRLHQRASAERFDARAAARVLALELALAAALLAVATALGQTVPARHDANAWWLPFRISVDATWDTPGVAASAFGGRCSSRSRPCSPAGSHEAARAHGDGPLAATLALRPADFTEPHTALHTAGDIFWWLTHGEPPGVMPGFADRLNEDERWDLINFVRTLSSGYQARVLTERIVPRAPWLASVDFSFVTGDGASGTLKDDRGRSAMLLVFYTLPGSAQRMAQLAADHPRLRTTGVEVFAIPVDAAGAQPPAGLAHLTEGAQETVRTYALLRRTLSNADAHDVTPVPAHTELRVDRFGYIRARWLPGESEGWGRIELLHAQLDALAREPQVRPPPEDHVH